MSEEELLEVLLHLATPKPAISLLCLVLGLFELALYYSSGNVYVGVIGCWLTLFALWNFLFLPWFYRRRLRDPNYAILTVSRRAIINEEKFTLEGIDGISLTIPWSQFCRIGLFKGNYLLYVFPRGAIIMFRRGIAQDDWEQFTEWAEERWAEIDVRKRRAN